MFNVVFVTAPDGDMAKKIAKKILTMRLAACVNINKNLESLYWWQGEIQEEGEVLMIFKTASRLLPSLEEEIRRLHPYQVPEIIALPIVHGYGPYLKWIEDETVGALHKDEKMEEPLS